MRKPDSQSTPLRIVTNSSYKGPAGKSFNEITVKGPPSLNSLMDILLRFRTHKIGITGDIQKMYHSVMIHDDQRFLRRIMWRPKEVWDKSFKEVPPDIYHFCTIQFGERPAGCAVTTCLRNTAKKYEPLSPKAAETIANDAYVDDAITGEKDVEQAKQLIEDIKKITAPGGFIWKSFTITGDQVKDQDILGENLGSKVLGIKWSPKDDTLVFKTVVNPSSKRRGKKTGDDWNIEDIERESSQLTRRKLLRVVNSIFDPLGLLSPYTVLLKIGMKLANGYGWDEKLSEEVTETWSKLLRNLCNFKIECNRSILHDVSAYQSAEIIGFADASKEAYACVIYTRFEVEPSNYKVNLLTAKTRVAPEMKISIPRLELLSALLLSRLMKTVQAAIKNIEFKKCYKIVDSSSTLGMINKTSTALQEFTGTRVGEIYRNDQVMEDSCPGVWLHCPGEENPADKPSRGVSDPAFIESDLWNHGPKWLQLPIDQWPTKEAGVFKEAPIEEMHMKKTCLLVVGDLEKKCMSKSPLYSMAKKCGTLKKMLRITAWILRLFREKGKKKVPLDARDLAEAQKYWEKDANSCALKYFKKGFFKPLRARLDDNNQVVCSGRLPQHALKIGYDVEEIKIIPGDHVFAKLFIGDVHEKFGHPGVDRTVDISRHKFWIPNARRIANSVWKTCLKCKQIDRKTQNQLMAQVKIWRTVPAPVFTTTCLDLFGPLHIRDNVKKKMTRNTTLGKCWGVIFTCTTTGAVSVDITEDYSTDSMHQCLRRFVCEHGQPSCFITDKGSQLTAAEKEINPTPNWDDLVVKNNAIKWLFSPTEAHHYNGLAEVMVKRTKRTLETVLSKEILTFGNLMTMMKEVKNIINSRPLGPNLSDDPSSGPALTPNHLLLAGRATVEIPQGDLQETSLNKKYIFIQNLVKEFWKKWYRSVFPTLLPSYKWKNTTRNIQPGDVVLIYQESISKGSYPLGKYLRSPSRMMT